MLFFQKRENFHDPKVAVGISGVKVTDAICGFSFETSTARLETNIVGINPSKN